MTPDVLTQLQTYTEHMDSLAPPVDELASQQPTVLQPLVPRPRRRWLVVVLAVVATLVLLIGPVLLMRANPVVEQPVATTLPSDAVSGQWSRSSISEGEDLDPELVNAVAAGGPGVVAVGRERVSFDSQTGASVDRPTIWTSSDGLAWSRVPHDEAVFGQTGAVIDIAASEFGLIAIGQADGIPAIWISEDGRGWERLSDDQVSFGKATLERVVADGDGAIIIGFGGQFVGSGPEPTVVVDEDNQPLDVADLLDTQRVWVTQDGETWTRVSDDGGAFAGARIDPGAIAIGATAVLVGERCEPATETSLSCEPSVWLSDNRQVWERHVRQGPDFAEVGVGDMVWFGTQLVAATRDPTAPVWISNDAVTWTPAPSDQTAFPTLEPESEFEPAGPIRLNAMAVGPNGIVAVGRGGHEQGGEVPAIWTSSNGLTWNRVPYDEALFGPAGDGPEIHDVVATANGYVAVGDIIIEADCQQPLLSLCRARSAWTGS